MLERTPFIHTCTNPFFLSTLKKHWLQISSYTSQNCTFHLLLPTFQHLTETNIDIYTINGTWLYKSVSDPCQILTCIMYNVIRHSLLWTNFRQYKHYIRLKVREMWLFLCSFNTYRLDLKQYFMLLLSGWCCNNIRYCLRNESLCFCWLINTHWILIIIWIYVN